MDFPNSQYPIFPEFSQVNRDESEGVTNHCPAAGRKVNPVQEARTDRDDTDDMVGASRLPGYSKHCSDMKVDQYIEAVLNGELFDPALSIHLKDGWTAVRPIHGYLQHDADSAGWAMVIQWINPDCPPPPEFDLSKLPAISPSKL